MDTEWKKEKTPRELASEAKKEHIYKCAVELFKEYGYNQISVKDIAKKSGMSEGSIFNFFGSKAGILSSFADKLDEHTKPYIALTDENLNDPYTAILKNLLAHGELINDIGWELTSLFYNNVPERYEGILDIDEPSRAVAHLFEPSITFLEEAMRRGTLRSRYSAEDITTMLYTFCNGLVLTWTRCKGTFSLMKLSEPMIRKLMDSIFDN